MIGKNDNYNKRLFESIVNGVERPQMQMRTPRTDEEHEIQRNCVLWFRLQYRQYEKMLYAIPNGGFRGKATAAKLKAEGVVAGVADLCLAVPRGGYGALYIEMKQRGNYQQPNQKEWQKACEAAGNKYVVCKSIEEFMREVNAYMYLPSAKMLMNELGRLRR